jgi:hypothetical protein
MAATKTIRLTSSRTTKVRTWTTLVISG